MKNLMNKTALTVMSSALTLALALIFALNETPSALAQSATPTATATATATATPAPIDYDSDNDGLIDIGYPDQLNAMRHDPNGLGNINHSDYTAAFPNAEFGMGCPVDLSLSAIPKCRGYELVDDIDLVGYSNWTPIPAWETTFAGREGGYEYSYSISNMTTTGAGLFGSIGESGTVTNVALEDATVTFAVTAGESRTPLRHVGVLVGENEGRISHVHVEGVLTFTGVETDRHYAHVGGLVGRNNGGTINLSFADVDISIIGGGARAGGFVGDNRGSGATITASFASGDVTVSAPSTYVKKRNRVGGFVGVNKGFITNSMTVGEVSPRRHPGTQPFGPVCWGGGRWINVAPGPSGCAP